MKSKICPICGKLKSMDSFTYHTVGTVNMRPVCNLCGEKMSERLSALTDADLKICMALKLDFHSVTDYEAGVRHDGKFHREIGLVQKRDIR